MSYVTPWSGSLAEGTYRVTMPSNVQVGTSVYNFVKWEDESTSPVRTFQLVVDASITATYVLAPPPPPAKGKLEIHAYLGEAEIEESGTIVETAQQFTTPITIELDPGTYTVKIRDQTRVAVVVEGQTLRIDFVFAPPTPIPPLMTLAWFAAGLTSIITTGGVVIVQELKKARIIP